MNSPAIVRGVTVVGDVVYYTGRAGEGWVSANRAEAFAGYSLEGARRKALQLNRHTDGHGVRFVAILRD